MAARPLSSRSEAVSNPQDAQTSSTGTWERSSDGPAGSRETESSKPLLDAAGEQEGIETGSMASSEDFEMDDIASDGGLDDDEETGLTKKARNKRARRKRRNTQLDQRVYPSPHLKKEEDWLTNRTVWKRILMNVLFIGLWYTFSISISVYNKWMFKDEDGQKKIVFPFPLFTTCVHMFVQFTLSSLILFLVPHFRPTHGTVHPHHSAARRDSSPPEEPSEKGPIMTTWFYVSRIGPCGAATGLDIGLGNTSLKTISLTFYTMCKSSVLGFVLLFAILFRLEKPSWRLAAIITTMTIGVIMMVAGETAFDVLGFFLVMSASASSGFRWSLTQILLLRNPATSNPFSSIFFLAPVMFFTLFIIAIPAEGFGNVSRAFGTLAAEHGILLSMGILLFPGCLAFAMTASEFALLQRTSVVTLSIAGIFKEVLTISTASIVFQDELTPINASGLVVTIATIAYYNYIKIQSMREEARVEAHMVVEQEYAPVLAHDRDTDLPVPRQSTGDLIRSSLSIHASGDGLGRGGIRRATPVDSSARVSPVKRPEDLD